MQYFLDTVDTIPEGCGFQHFGKVHIVWLCIFLITVIANCLWYRQLGDRGRKTWNKTVAAMLVANELFKMVILFIGGNYAWDYLPLHLCSINIFLIALHAWKPSDNLGNFLYTICIPGTLAALLFPTWTSLPVLNGMHLHSFTVHILLALYPIVLTVSGQIKPSVKMMPKCMGILLLMAIPVYGLNLLLNTNFMFLMYADEGNPLYWFGQNWGSHLLGFPVIIAAVLIVMYLPLELLRKRKKSGAL